MILELCDTRTTCGACGAHLRLSIVDDEPIGGIVHELDCPACGAHVPLPPETSGRSVTTNSPSWPAQ